MSANGASARRPCRFGLRASVLVVVRLDAVFEALGLGERLQFLQRVVLYLTDPLASHAEGTSDLFEGARRHAEQTEAELDHLALPLGQRGQCVLDVLAPQ